MPSTRPLLPVVIAVLVLTTECPGPIQYWALPPSENRAVDRLEAATAEA